MKWVEFVKDYAKKNNIKYGEALKKAKDAWKKHKAESPEHTAKKSKPKKKATKAKKSKSKAPKKDNIQMKITEAKKKNVAFALEKDQMVQESLKKRKAREDLEEALSKEKGQTELILEARAKGFSAGTDSVQEARKQLAKQKIKLSELKADAGVPIGGGFDPNVLTGVRKTKLAKYKKLKAKVDLDMKMGKVNNKEFNSLIALAKHLAGKSKTNAYAKLVKKYEKQIESKAYANASRRQMRQAQKSKLLSARLEKAQLQDKARTQRQTIGKVFSNRKKALMRLGATEEEAEKIAKEEERTYKESSDLARELQIAKSRKGLSANMPTGGLSYNQFVEKTSKDKGIPYQQAANVVKSQNLFTKYQISAVGNLKSGTSGITALPTFTPPTDPAIVARGQYLDKKGNIKKTSKKAIDNLIKKYKGTNVGSSSDLYKVARTPATVRNDMYLADKYRGLAPLTQDEKNRLNELYSNLQVWEGTGLDLYKESIKVAKAPPSPKPTRSRTPAKGKGKAPVISVVSTSPPSSPPPSPTPSGTGTLRALPQLPKMTIATDKARKSVQDILNDSTLGDDDKFSALGDLLDVYEKKSGDNKGSIRLIKSKQKDLDEDIGGAGLAGGFMGVYDESDLVHTGDPLGGALNVRELGKKFKSKLSRKFQQLQEPINLVVRGVGKLKGRKVVKQNAIDPEDVHKLKMTIASYSKAEDRRDIEGFKYNPQVSNEEHAVWVNDGNKSIVVAYRGSRTQEDWLVSDKHIAKGELEKSDRYKRESEWVKGLLDVVPKDYKVEFTGSSLGGTLAYTLGHAHKQRAVIFNAGVGVDGAKKHGEDNTKNYHAEGDPISIMGLGAFKDNRMIRNTSGNFATAHSTSVFLPPSKGGFSKGEYPEDGTEHLQQNSQDLDIQEIKKETAKLADEAVERRPLDSNEMIKTPPQQTPPTNASHYGDLGDFTPNGQADIENMTQRDIDTYTNFSRTSNDGKGGSLKMSLNTIAKRKIESIHKDIKEYENDYSPQALESISGGAFDLQKWVDKKNKHDTKLEGITRQIQQLRTYRKRVSGGMGKAVDTHNDHFNHKLKYLIQNHATQLPNILDKHLCNSLDNRKLTDLHIHNTMRPNRQNFNKNTNNNYVENKRHHINNAKVDLSQDHEGHKRMVDIANKLGKKLVEKIRGGNLTNRNHLKILEVASMPLNKLKKDPHYHMVIGDSKGQLTLKTI